MKRAVVVGLALAAIVAGVAIYLGVRGGDGDPVVARVAGEPIRKSQLESVVHHFRLEAEAEGRPFPAESTPEGRRARNRLLGLLVYRAELRNAARRLGIQVTRVQVLRRLNADLQVPSPRQYGIDRARYEELLPVMASQALASGSPANNPRVPDAAEIVELYRRVYE